MRLKNPVADVDDVDVLLDDDVAGERAVVNPIAQPTFPRGRVGPGRAVDIAGEIVRFSAYDFAERACMNAANHFDERRTITNLKADVKAELSVDAFTEVDDLVRPRNIDRDRFFEIDVLACAHNGFKM